MENLDKHAGMLIAYLNSADAFLKAQVPDFVAQFIAYETWRAGWLYGVSLTVLLILLGIQIVIMVRMFKRGEDRSLDGDWMGPFAVIGIAGTVSLGFFIETSMDLKKLELAPKVYMVEQARTLISGHQRCN